MMTLSDGDRVLLTIMTRYHAAKSNPIKGSTYECPGTIEAIDDDGKIHVLWDNDYRNTYDSTDLSLHSEMSNDNPNRAYKMEIRGFGHHNSYFTGKARPHVEEAVYVTGRIDEYCFEDANYFTPPTDDDLISFIGEEEANEPFTTTTLGFGEVKINSNT